MKKVLDSTFEGKNFNVSAPDVETAQEIIKFAAELGASVVVYRAEYKKEDQAQRRVVRGLLERSTIAALKGDDAKADALKNEAKAKAEEYGINLIGR